MRWIGKICGANIDRDSDELLWLIVRTGRTRPEYHAVPRTGAACGNGRVWIGLLRGTVLSSPPLLVRRPLSQAMEASLCDHYELPPTAGLGRIAFTPPRWSPSAIPRDSGAWAAMVATHAAPLPAPMPGLAPAG